MTPEVSVIEYLIYYTQSALIHTEKILLFATFMLLESLLKKLREYSTRIIALSKLRFLSYMYFQIWLTKIMICNCEYVNHVVK